MHEVPTPWKHGVVLVCANQRPDGAAKPSCGHHKGTALKAWLKTAAREQEGPVSQCRVMTVSCLDVCPAEGVAVAMMPGNHIVVVDAEADRDALLAKVSEHMDNAARNPGGPPSRVRKVLNKLRGG